VMRATASGWLSLTPRSSRRRATIAAIAIKSLSFSLGVRFMGAPPSSLPSAVQQISGLRSRPEPRFAPVERDNGRHERRMQPVRRGGEKARDNEAVEGAGAALHSRAPG